MTNPLQCTEAPSCDWKSNADKNTPEAQQEYTIHFIREHQNGARPKDQRAKPKLINRPTIDMGCTPAGWDDFFRRWDRYKLNTALLADQVIGQLRGCLSAELESNAAASLDLEQMLEADILSAVKGLAVAPVSIGMRRAEVMRAKQQHAEQFRIYVCRVNNGLQIPHAMQQG